MAASFQLYLITDRKLMARHGGMRAAAEAALSAASAAAPPGAVALQLRERDAEAHELYEQGRALHELCSRWRAPLLVNDRLDVALACGADGVHLRGDSFGVADARRLLGPQKLIGVSTHTADEVAAASRGRADFVVFGPVYAPISKAAGGAAGGPEGLGAACRAAGATPVYALGGITAERIGELATWAGARAARGRPRGVAVIGAVWTAPDPGVATAELLRALQRMW